MPDIFDQSYGRLVWNADDLPVNEDKLINAKIHYNVNGHIVQLEKNYDTPETWKKDIVPTDGDTVIDRTETIGLWYKV